MLLRATRLIFLTALIDGGAELWQVGDKSVWFLFQEEKTLWIECEIPPTTWRTW